MKTTKKLVIFLLLLVTLANVYIVYGIFDCEDLHALNDTCDPDVIAACNELYSWQGCEATCWHQSSINCDP